MLGLRVQALETNMVDPTVLQSQYAALSSRVDALEVVSPPVVELLFSDLTHAPKSGWSGAEPNKGAAVTVWHQDLVLSPVRGNNYITVNGVNLTVDTDYAEWNADSYDVLFLRRTTFWINSLCADGLGSITITLNGVTSNALPFSVIPGNIRFINKDATGTNSGTLTNPWTSPTFGVTRTDPGDVVYFRETATPYNQKYLGGRSNFYMTRQEAGTESAPKAFVSYPGEKATLSAKTTGIVSSVFAGVPDWWTISKFSLIADTYCARLDGDGSRIVGCDCEGGKVFATGIGIIMTLGSRHDILGCSAHGGTTVNKLDHAIYCSGDASRVRGCEVGYNHVYDNNFAAGPMVVINHQQTRIPNGQSCKEHRIHNNLIDCTKHKSRGIGIYSQSWETGNSSNEQEPETALIYNNVLDGCGFENSGPAIYQVNGKARWTGNTLNNCQVLGVLVGDSDVLLCEFIANKVHMASGKYLTVVPGSTVMTINGNEWTGAGNPPVQDSNPL